MGILKKILILFILFVPAFSLAAERGGRVWTKIDGGFFYKAISSAPGDEEASTIHAFRIDPKKFRIDVVTAADEVAGATAEELAVREKALLVINGGFFTPEHRSIGLVVKNGRELKPIHMTSWWSVFAIAGDTPRIFTPREFKKTKDVKTALQAGPRLVVDGSYPKLKEGVAARSGIGIDFEGFVVIATTSGPGISLADFARRFGSTSSQGGLGCRNTMALDGGGSAQLYTKVKNFSLTLPNVSRVTNGVAVFQK